MSASDGGYPAHWEADVVLADGGTAHVRPIVPADAEALQRFHVGQSPESTYYRFFAPMPRLSASDLHRFTHVDHVDRVALVATVGEAIVGVARFDRVDPGTAEVAFNVADAHRGRGLGSVLLEHLAAAARERGVARFVADVLPGNRRMLSVFTDAGFAVTSSYEDGVVSLSFTLEANEAQRAVMEAREHRAESRSLAALLAPRSIAVFGASRRPGTVGHRLLADLLGAGFTGSLSVVHPEAEAVLGVPALRRLDEAGTPVDLAVVAVPAAAVLEVVKECARHGVRGLVVLSGGFAERGGEGLRRQRDLVSLARANGMRLVGPNSWGVVNAGPDVRLNASLAPELPRSGRLALFCQSGAMAVSVVGSALARNIGISSFVSAGNRADVSGNDCMQYWEEDPATEVVGLYLESSGNPRKFSRIARRLARRKPVVVVTAAASGYGVPPGHQVRRTTAAPEAYAAMLRQSGCIRVENVRQLLDVAQLLLAQPLPRGGRVGIVANSDALAALIADVCVGWDLQVGHGPVALPPQAGAEDVRSALEAAVADPDVDSVVAAFVPPVATDLARVGEAVAVAARGTGVPVVACYLDTARVSVPGREVAGVPAYPTPEEAVRALAAVTRYAAWRGRPAGSRVDPPGCDRDGARALVERLLAGSVELACPPEAARDLLACYGIDLWPAVAVTGDVEAVAAAERLGFPVAVKTTARHLRHRVDLGGVRLGVAGPAELRDVVRAMRADLGPLGSEELVVQRMAPAGVACVVRTVEDPLFGPVVSFGVGGDASDLLGDWSHRIPPLTEADVSDLVRSVRAAPKLFGHRGAREADVVALEDVLARVSRLADDVPEVAELELNPVVVAERGLAVLGAEIRLAAPPGRSDGGRRVLTSG